MNAPECPICLSDAADPACVLIPCGHVNCGACVLAQAARASLPPSSSAPAPPQQRPVAFSCSECNVGVRCIVVPPCFAKTGVQAELEALSAARFFSQKIPATKSPIHIVDDDEEMPRKKKYQTIPHLDGKKVTATTIRESLSWHPSAWSFVKDRDYAALSYYRQTVEVPDGSWIADEDRRSLRSDDISVKLFHGKKCECRIPQELWNFLRSRSPAAPQTFPGSEWKK